MPLNQASKWLFKFELLYCPNQGNTSKILYSLTARKQLQIGYTSLIKMKICFLHLGFHKTATTSFQNTCGANRLTLEKHKIRMPDFSTESGQPSFNHTFPIHNIYETPANNATHHQNNLMAWKKLLNSNQNILISGEGILKMSTNSTKNLLKDINTSGLRLKPFACARTPYSFMNSALKTRLKMDNFTQ